MDDASPLARLADAYGIAASYDDAKGATVAVSDATKERLLAAMGARTEQAADLLAEMEEAEWGRGLPPVIVDRSGGKAVAVEVTLPAGAERVAWKLTLETCEERFGETAIADTELVDRRVAEDACFERRRIVIGDAPLGYHTFALNEPGVSTTLIVAPSACWLPEAMTGGRRTYGLAVQLPLVRSARDWGIGDFADLRHLLQIAAARGADVVGVNPLHALFQDAPEAASPYSPASRLLLNPLFIAVDEVFGWHRAQDFAQSDPVLDGLEAVRAAELVDYAHVATLKLAALRHLFVVFKRGADEGRRDAFERFMAERGEGFRRACLFLALREHFAREGRPDWRTWPEDYRSPVGDGALAFSVEKPEAVEFQAWMQWVADEQLSAVANAAEAEGMAVGLYRDLAVGADPAGAETWSNPDAVIRGAAVGAPPDIFMPAGQNWGLPPFHPRALRAEAYASFVELLRANMRHAGGLRIDHVMGLLRLWCVPENCPAGEGAYVGYPFDDMLGVLALESHRNRCLVVGEDLGTVPEGFRDRMAEENVLSYRVLFFEMDFDTGEFTPSDDYPEKALAVAGSHDLATLRGWWLGRDNDVKERLGLFPSADEAAAQRARRDRDKAAIVSALAARGHGTIGEPDAFAATATAFLAETRSVLALVQLDDLTGETEQVNVPSTVDENPNWRRKYRLTLEEIAADEALWAPVAPMAQRRGPTPLADD
jgi:4-alpha-glucanotransferase